MVRCFRLLLLVLLRVLSVRRDLDMADFGLIVIVAVVVMVGMVLVSLVRVDPIRSEDENMGMVRLSRMDF